MKLRKIPMCLVIVVLSLRGTHLCAQTPPGSGTSPGTVANSLSPVAAALTDECNSDEKDGDAQKRSDDRCDFESSFYVGTVIDSFAAAELNHYINPNDAQSIKEGYVAGVDFAYRFYRTSEKNHPGRDWWVYGETIHGVRSADVDCKAHPDIAVCGNSTNDKFLYILRKASSLESYVGLRYEIPLKNPRTGDIGSGRFFLASQLGFLTVAGTGGDIVDNHTWISAGLMNVNGRFSGSYLQAGVGKTDLFHDHKNARFKVDGFLSMTFTKADVVRPFLQMTVDSDGRGGADSVQSYFGIDVNFGPTIKALFGGGS
ncbi:MAG: hypothetical protein QOF63_2589 [Thermoanaerobaculia bacterium]|jgi:hypothetical protein|nr:hypothetical protein [Thermoanaerobaculia bacterium]